MKAFLLRFVVVASLLCGGPARAGAELDHPQTQTCITTAASAFAIPETPLWVILDVERGQVGKVSRNSNGTYDIGPMQINSAWLGRLRRMGISEQDLLYNRCINIYVGAWIFTKEYQRFGDLAKAIAHYHSPTAVHQRRYLGLIQQAIQRRIRKLQDGGVPVTAPAPTQPAPMNSSTVVAAVAPSTLLRAPIILSSNGAPE